MKYYQYLIGENRGKVVSLTKVDDLSNPLMTLFVFDDGFKCNEDLVADINDINAYAEGKILAEVESPSNIWKFTETEIKAEEKFKSYNGKEFQAADPYFIDKNGNQNVGLNSKVPITERKKIEAFPPRRSRSKLESIDEYRASNMTVEKEEFDYNAQPVEIPETPKEQEEKYNYIEKLNQWGVYEISDSEKPKNPVNSKVIWDNQSLKIHNAEDIYIYNVFDEEDNKLTYRNLYFVNDDEDKTFNINLKEAAKILLDTVRKTEHVKTGAEIMLDNCIKSEADVNMTLSIKLPKPAVYKMIKENYPSEWSSQFIQYIVDNLNINEIKKALVDSLTSIYDEQTSESASE